MAKVRFWSISREDWEAGVFMVCSKCGRKARHIIEVNGQAFGPDCGAELLGWRVSPTQATATVRHLGISLRWLVNVLDLQSRGELRDEESILVQALQAAEDVMRVAEVEMDHFLDVYRQHHGWERVRAVVQELAAL